MSKTHTDEQERQKQINNSTCYLFGGSVFSIGKSKRSREFINKLEMPKFPLLAANKKERADYAASVEPWYSLLGKYASDAMAAVSEVLEEERNKKFIPHNALNLLESPRTTDPEDDQIVDEKEVMA